MQERPGESARRPRRRMNASCRPVTPDHSREPPGRSPWLQPREVARGVYRVNLRGVNAFLIDAGDGLVLIDAGLKGSPPRISEAIYALDRLPQDVVAIVVTHAHRDHVGGLAEMKRRTGAEVWMHPADAALVRDGLYGRPFGRGQDRSSSALRQAMNLLPSPE